MTKPDLSQPSSQGESYKKWTLIIQAFLALSTIAFVFRRDWENVFLTVIVILLTMLPAFVSRRYRVYVPPEFQLIAVVFTFLSLFLGSARDFILPLLVVGHRAAREFRIPARNHRLDLTVPAE